MDDYYIADTPAQSRELKEIDSMGDFAIDEIGASSNPMQHQTEALKARIFHGANKVELGFMGHGKGNKEQSTPGSYGKREREDMLNLAEYNKVETSTHATVSVSGLSGLRQDNFDEAARKESCDEVRRAIHFASEATTGGAIVMHTGESPRPMFSNFKDEVLTDGTPVQFKMHPFEETEEMNYIVDPKTRRIVGRVKNTDYLALPVEKKDANGKIEYLKDENGEYVIDDIMGEYDKEHGGKIPMYEIDNKGNIQTELITFNEWKKRKEEELRKEKGKLDMEDREKIIKSFFQKQQILQIQYNIGFSKGSESRYKMGLEHREKIIKALNFYKELRKKVPEDEWWKYKKSVIDMGAQRDGLVPADVEDPIDYLQKSLDDTNRELIYGKELGLSGRRQARETLDMVNRSQLIEKYATQMSALSMGELGVYTWQQQHNANQKFKEGKRAYKLKNDMYLAPENLFPEAYGAHPDELKTLIKMGREEMAHLLVKEWHKSPEEAKKLAQKHIKATFDIGHANIWRKYMVPKKGESLEDRDKRFNKWLLEKTKTLLKEGYIGHIHISDNFGFHDEHLSAGDGNAPIREFIKMAKKEGIAEFIVESGSFNPLRSLPDTWNLMDSPVYHMSVPGVSTDRWTDFYWGYFGKTEGPRYVVGEYAPSDDFKGAPFYSGLPLE